MGVVMVGEKRKDVLVWSPYTKEQLRAQEEEKKRRPALKELNLIEELTGREVVVLHPTSEAENREAFPRLDPLEGIAGVGQVAEWSFSELPILTFDRLIKISENNEFALLRPCGSMTIKGGDGRDATAKGIIMAGSLRILPKERPLYIVGLAPLLVNVDESVQTLSQADIGKFCSFTVRIPRKDRGKEPPVNLPGTAVQFAMTLPGPFAALPDGVIVKKLDTEDGKEWFSEAFLVKLTAPLVGLNLGIPPWQTDYVVIAPRYDGGRVRYGLDSDFVGYASVNLLRPINEQKVLEGHPDPGNLIPYAAARLLPAGTAPAGVIDGTFFYGVPHGEIDESVSFTAPEDQDIPELHFDPKTMTQMTMPADMLAIAVKAGTPATEIEKKTGKKMKLYGSSSTNPSKGWIYIAEEDDRLIVRSQAKRVWNDYKELAKLVALSMNEGYLPEAEEFLNRLLELKPGNRLAICLLAGVKAGRGNFVESERMLKEVLAKYPFWGFPKMQLVKVYLLQNKIEDARVLLNEAVVGNPDDLDRIGLLYRMYVDHLKNERGGRWRILALAASYPLTPGPLVALATLTSDENKQASLEFARAACERRSDDMTIASFSGSLGEAGRVEEAIAVLEHFRAANMLGEKSLGNLAFAYESAKKPDRAVEIVRQLKEKSAYADFPSLDAWEKRLISQSGGKKPILKGIFGKKE